MIVGMLQFLLILIEVSVCEKDSIAVVAEGGGDDGSGTSMRSGFRKEGINCALIEGVICAS